MCCCGEDCMGNCLVGTVISCAGCWTGHRKGAVKAQDESARPVESSRLPKLLKRAERPWVAHPGTGADYQVPSAVLHRLQQRWQRPSQRKHSPALLKPLGVSKAKLHVSLLESLSTSLTPDQEDGRLRLQTAFSNLDARLETPDLVIKIVPDLDLLLFDRVLSDNVAVFWSDLSCDDRGRCDRGFHKAQIRLNKALFYNERKGEVLGTLIHEMIHAYFMVLERPWDWAKGSRREHEWSPGLAHGMVRRLGMDGFEERHVL